MDRTNWDGVDRRDLGERVAVLESTITDLKADQKIILEAVNAIKDEVIAGRMETSKYKGMLGGAVLVISAVATSLGFFGGYIKDHWR